MTLLSPPKHQQCKVHLDCFFLLALFSCCSIVSLQQNTVLHKCLQYGSWTAVLQEGCGSPTDQSFCQKPCFSMGFSCFSLSSGYGFFRAPILALAWSSPQTAGWISAAPWSYAGLQWNLCADTESLWEPAGIGSQT